MPSNRTTVQRLRETLELHSHRPVVRGYCVDCEAAVVLMRDGSCPCGSRSDAPLARRAA
jgi:hypothetical protein